MCRALSRTSEVPATRVDGSSDVLDVPGTEKDIAPAPRSCGGLVERMRHAVGRITGDVQPDRRR
jgi:hypothetical protein